MSWKRSSRCPYCGRRLPLYRALAGEFCSAAHRQQFAEEQNRLGLERLFSARRELPSHEPWSPAPEAEEASATVSESPAPLADVFHEIPSPLCCELPRQELGGALDSVGQCAFPKLLRPQVADILQPRKALPARVLPLGLAAPGEISFRWALCSLAPIPFAAPSRVCFPILTATPDSRFDSVAWEPVTARQPGLLPLAPGLGRRTIRRTAAQNESSLCLQRLKATPAHRELFAFRWKLATCPRPPGPPGHGLLEIAKGRGTPPPESRMEFSGEPEPLRSRVWIPVEPLPAAEMRNTGVRKLPLDEVPLVHGIWVEELAALESQAWVAVLPGLQTCDAEAGEPELAAELAGCLAVSDRYLQAVAAGCPRAGVLHEPEEFCVSWVGPEVAADRGLLRPAGQRQLPIPPARGESFETRNRTSQRHADAAQPVREAVVAYRGLELAPGAAAPGPPPNSLMALGWQGSLQGNPVPEARTAVTPAADSSPVSRPVLRVSPQQVNPRASFRSVWKLGRRIAEPALASLEKLGPFMPRDPRILAVLAAVLLLAVFRPYLPRIAKANSKPAAELGAAVSGGWHVVKHKIASRAGVDLADDFRSGLDSWFSRGDKKAGWSYDATGFVRPGSLAFYEPSMNLSDYHVELLAHIDRRGLGVAVRASGFDRYQAVKLVVTHPGPLPTVALVHYPVINGRAGSRSEVPLPFPVRGDTIYHLKIEARGPDFIVYVQNSIVAFWSDRKFRNGGVGLFCSKGEDARVRWIEVMHQYDALGRLCAYLAPYGVQTSN